MNQIKTIDGHLNAADLKFAILATRFNDFIVDRLVGGAVDYPDPPWRIRGKPDHRPRSRRLRNAPRLQEAGRPPANTTASSPSAPSSGAGRLILISWRPKPPRALPCVSRKRRAVGSGLLTTDNIEQAIERAGTRPETRALKPPPPVLETVRVLQQI